MSVGFRLCTLNLQGVIQEEVEARERLPWRLSLVISSQPQRASVVQLASQYTMMMTRVASQADAAVCRRELTRCFDLESREPSTMDFRYWVSHILAWVSEPIFLHLAQ